MVNDAIRCLGLESVVQAHLEVALYSMVSDFIFLKMKEGVMFAIEIKALELRMVWLRRLGCFFRVCVSTV